VEEGLRRKKKDNEWNRLDAYTVEFHQRVRTGYLQMVKAEPNRWVVIDAGRKWNIVQGELRTVILDRLRTR
jgi:dTMP kinase